MKVNQAGVRLRQAPSTSSNIVMESIPTTSSLIPLDPVGAWIHVKIDGIVPSLEGWVAYSLVDPIQPESDQQYTLEELMPMFEDTFPPQVLAAICYQESTFINFRVHADQTGHGLFGLDDNGLLPDFERRYNMTIGRGPTANIIPVPEQIEYAKSVLQQYSIKYGGPYVAARVWHRGESSYQDSYGDIYEQLIRQHVSTLFP